MRPDVMVSFLLASTGLHLDHVFPTVLEGQASSLPRNPPQPDAGQQGRRPTLGPRHLLPQRQEVFRPRSHGQKPHDPPASGRNGSLRAQVCSSQSLSSRDRFSVEEQT